MSRQIRKINGISGNGFGLRPWCMVCLLGCVWPALPAAGQVQIKERRPTFKYRVRLKLKSPAELSPGDVKYAAIPGGKHVGLSYTGVTDPKTIAFFTKLGFRTSVAVTQATSPERLQALEAAGADLVCAGGVGPEMGLTPQEAFDGATMRRVRLQKHCRSPVAVGPYNNMRNNRFLPINRGMGRYLYAIHDSNYLACNSWAAGYKVIVGRNRTPEQIIRPHNSNSVRSAPNTLIYYQTVANILQGFVEMMSPGEVTTIGLRDFKARDLKKVDRFIGKYGKDPRIWHTTQHEIAGYAYTVEKSRVTGVDRLGPTELEIALAVEQDTYLPFCIGPLCLRLPKGFPLASARMGATNCPVAASDKGVFVDVPLQQAFRDGCTMTLVKPPSMSIPEDMPVTLVIKNTSDKPLTGVRLQWSSNVGTEVVGGEQGPFTLAAKAERKVQAAVRTIRGPRRGIRPKGARFGLAPISAFLAADSGGEKRTYLASWEILIAPRLRVEMDPRMVPIAQGDSYPVFLHVANGKVDTDRAWGEMNTEKLIDHRAGPCKGTVGFNLPDGMEAVPPTQQLDLPANGHATFRFLIKNHKWGDRQAAYVRPAIRLAGEADPIEVPWYGTAVMRDEKMRYEPLDAKGLLAYAGWDDKNNTHANLDRASGSKVQSCPGAGGGGSTPSHEGVKGWCIGWNSNVAFDAFRNIDYHRGTVLFWTRRDPRVRNDIRVNAERATSWQVSGAHKNFGEKLFCAGLGRDLILRRFPRKREKEGYLELVLRELPVRARKTKTHYVQADYDTARLYDWRHLAIVWDIPARRLELYIDGKLAGKAPPGEGEWLVLPWDRGRRSNCLVLPETHHGHWSGSLRDEFYIYNRPLTAKEIKQNMALAKR